MAPIFTGSKFGFSSGGISRVLVETINAFSAPGSVTIPAATTSVLITSYGGQNNYGDVMGGYVRGTFTTLSGITLNVSITGKGVVGPGGNGNSNPGGNYAGVFNGPVSQANSLMIAGGAGGDGYNNFGNVFGGAGGGTTGGTGDPGLGAPSNATGGTGGSQSAGGSGGTAGPSPDSGYPSLPGGSGSALQGGYGGPGSWWGGVAGGTGGGGYYGGGGGGAGMGGPGIPLGTGGGGGGGSSYIHPTATGTTNTQGGAPATLGYVEITYSELL